MHREPVIVWSFIIGGIGTWPGALEGEPGRGPGVRGRNPCAVQAAVALAARPWATRGCGRKPSGVIVGPAPPFAGLVLPLVGPPIRESLGYGRKPLPHPPPIKDVLNK